MKMKNDAWHYRNSKKLMKNSLKCHWTLRNVQTFRAEPFICVQKPIVASGKKKSVGKLKLFSSAPSGSKKDRFHCHTIKKQIENHPVEKAKKFWCYRKQQNESLLQVLGLCVLPNFRYSLKCFAEIYRAQYGNAMLVYICGTPMWRPENSVNIWNLLWLSRRLIISTEQTSIYVIPFPNNVRSKKARNHEISIFFQQTRS